MKHSENGGILVDALTIIVVIVVIVNAYRYFNRETWQIAYLNKGGYAEITDKFSSKQACLDELHTGRYGDSGECGSNCKYKSDVDVYECDKTED